MGQVLHNNATTTIAIGKEIQEVSEEILKLNFGNRFRGILKSHGIDFQNFLAFYRDAVSNYLGEQ